MEAITAAFKTNAEELLECRRRLEEVSSQLQECQDTTKIMEKLKLEFNNIMKKNQKLKQSQLELTEKLDSLNTSISLEKQKREVLQSDLVISENNAEKFRVKVIYYLQ